MFTCATAFLTHAEDFACLVCGALSGCPPALCNSTVRLAKSCPRPAPHMPKPRAQRIAPWLPKTCPRAAQAPKKDRLATTQASPRPPKSPGDRPNNCPRPSKTPKRQARRFPRPSQRHFRFARKPRRPSPAIRPSGRSKWSEDGRKCLQDPSAPIAALRARSEAFCPRPRDRDFCIFWRTLCWIASSGFPCGFPTTSSASEISAPWLHR